MAFFVLLYDEGWKLFSVKGQIINILGSDRDSPGKNTGVGCHFLLPVGYTVDPKKIRVLKPGHYECYFI